MYCVWNTAAMLEACGYGKIRTQPVPAGYGQIHTRPVPGGYGYGYGALYPHPYPYPFSQLMECVIFLFQVLVITKQFKLVLWL